MSSGNFITRFFGAVWRGVNGLRKLLHLVLLLFIFMLFFGVMSGEAPPILPQKAALVVQPVGALVEQLSGNPYDRALSSGLPRRSSPSGNPVSPSWPVPISSPNRATSLPRTRTRSI